MMKKYLLAVFFLILLMSQSTFAKFSDVDYSWYPLAESIDWLERNGVVEGYGDGTFKPANSINRAEFLKMLYEAKGGLPQMSYNDSDIPFTDIPNGDVWYKKYIIQAYLDGVINGYPDGTFRPDNKINWAEALKIVMEGFLDVDKLYGDGSGDEWYADDRDIEGSYCIDYRADDEGVDINAWYWKYLCVADGLSLINFMRDDFVLNPAYDLTRLHMAMLLYNTKGVADHPKGLVHWDFKTLGYSNSGVHFPKDLNVDPEPICSYKGNDYYHADVFDAGDSCNVCSCDGKGVVNCTEWECSETPIGPNEFDLVSIQVGDKIGDMTVIEVGPAIGDGERTDYNGEIKFEGEVTVTGVYNYYGEESVFVGDSVCFEKLDAQSQLKIPNPAVAQKPAWFCFSNKEFAQSHFEEQTTGTATVVIDKYQVRYAETEIWDLAELVEVVEFEKTGDLSPTGALYLSSPAFNVGDEIPVKYTCDGENVNPPLEISGVPEVAKSLVLIVDDPDAPDGEWNHWTLWNIDPETTKIIENSVPAGAVEGTTSFGTTGYGGPCPPSGTHHYYFELNALDVVLDLPAGASKAELEAAMEGHVVEGVLFTGLYTFIQ